MNNKNKKICVISMSGGLDSTCLAAHMLAQGYEIRAFGFKYGQKHSVELNRLRGAIKVFKSYHLPISLNIIDLTDVFSDSASSLTDTNISVPEGHYEDSNMKSTVVENRNIIFSAILYSKALAISKKENTDVVITLGLHAGDHTVYPDTTKESQEMARELFRISNWGSERVDYIAPFNSFDKSQVLMGGVNSMRKMFFRDEDIDDILRNTISCYNPDSLGRSCGKCGTCTERIEAFEKCKLKDPIIYQ